MIDFGPKLTVKACTHWDDNRKRLSAAFFQTFFGANTQTIFTGDEPNERAKSHRWRLMKNPGTQDVADLCF